MKKPSVFDSLKRAAKKTTTRFGSCSSPTSVLRKAPPIRGFSSSSSSGGSDDVTGASGIFSRKELEATLRRLVPDPPTEEEVTAVLGSGGGGDIRLAELGGPPAGDELREAFSVFDVDGDGRISAEELLRVLVALGDEACSVDDCRRMIQGVDTEGDGFVCFDDFARMMDCKQVKLGFP